MLFVIGVLIGLIAGIMRTFMPSLGNWGMAIAIGMSSISTNLSIGEMVRNHLCWQAALWQSLLE